MCAFVKLFYVCSCRWYLIAVQDASLMMYHSNRNDAGVQYNAVLCGSGETVLQELVEGGDCVF